VFQSPAGGVRRQYLPPLWYGVGPGGPLFTRGEWFTPPAWTRASGEKFEDLSWRTGPHPRLQILFDQPSGGDGRSGAAGASARSAFLIDINRAALRYAPSRPLRRHRRSRPRCATGAGPAHFGGERAAADSGPRSKTRLGWCGKSSADPRGLPWPWRRTLVAQALTLHAAPRSAGLKRRGRWGAIAAVEGGPWRNSGDRNGRCDQSERGLAKSVFWRSPGGRWGDGGRRRPRLPPGW